MSFKSTVSNSDIRVRLPELSKFQNDNMSKGQRQNCKLHNTWIESLKISSIKERDLVLVQTENKGKLELVYDHRPYNVTEKKGSMVKALRTKLSLEKMNLKLMKMKWMVTTIY